MHFRVTNDTFYELHHEIGKIYSQPKYKGGTFEKSRLTLIWYLFKGASMIFIADRSEFQFQQCV